MSGGDWLSSGVNFPSRGIYGTADMHQTWGGWYPSEVAPSVTPCGAAGTAVGLDECPYCSNSVVHVYHDGICPRVKSKEYHQDGRLKRIEFHEVF